ncbi:Bacterial non-heme ferritin [Porphyridium purpureum]|uniref:Ferritin n=1 Tax=Porphyridium purpureum TaxID=35688 RepID=A0A5J4YUU0_PORPP|nr:Bacterial non-heme ferritin [Porphyridium purpureum]|eukprot:POR6229..scf227_4
MVLIRSAAAVRRALSTMTTASGGSMLSPNMEKALNAHVAEEFNASATYLSMSFYFKNFRLDGIANFFEKESLEERTHAVTFMNYMVKRGGMPQVPSVKAPKASWPKHVDVFADAYEHEKSISGKIQALAELAEKDGDKSTGVFLDEFIQMQIEEVASAKKNLIIAHDYTVMPGLIRHLDDMIGK